MVLSQSLGYQWFTQFLQGEGGGRVGWGGWGLLNGKGVVIGESGLFLRGNIHSYPISLD